MLITRGFRELAGNGEPALQHFGRLRIGDQRGQILRPQREVTPRQLVGIAHARDYNRTARDRCIVAGQHLR
jgi:hypothetical protein